ncbi:hypothetical protein BaRGS_00035858 [Batillaria attramentaria]|uniref:Fe2OG dioxygenase domain-containing protein n=1 Tax=Batillaria attramentaria TaxID=370345 RepID=A0ABD0JDM7_9CAEN
MASEFSPLHEAEADDKGQINFSEGELKSIPVPPQTDEEMCIRRSEILDFGDEGFLLHNVLSSTECQHFISEGEKAGFEKIHGARNNYRSNLRITFDSALLSDLLWKRIRPWLSDIIIDGEPTSLHVHGVKFLMQGHWQPLGLNSVWRLCRYTPGGHFAPHFDGHFVRSSQERSLQTFMLYINGDFEGGSTNFIDEHQTLYQDEEGKYCAEEKNILCRLQPEPGLAIIFNHHRLHEGQKLKTGVKYILRTDIMFRNITQASRSDSEEKALQLVQEAERKEASGECMEAAELYRKAFKLSPELAAAYGN